MIARKFHSFSVSIIYVNSKTFWESLQVLYLHIVWGLGLGEGLLKWLYYILTWFGRGVDIIQVVVVLYIPVLTWFGGWSCQWGDPWSADGWKQNLKYFIIVVPF